MIKDFWQKRKEEKKHIKTMKKQNKKQPKTKEEKAYKIFGVCFALFLIFGSMFYTCVGLDQDIDYSWDKLSGITQEMKDKLCKPVNKEDLMIDREINVVDWSLCKEALDNSGIGAVIVDNAIDSMVLIEKKCRITSPLVFDSRTLGALSQKLIQSSVYNDDVDLLEVYLFVENNQLMLTSVVRLNLASFLLGDNLPYIYVTTSSEVQILNNQMYSLNSVCKINKFSDEDNQEFLELINKNVFYDIDDYTNELIAQQINAFSEGVNAVVGVNNCMLELR